jgi:hypothetical protein
MLKRDKNFRLTKQTKRFMATIVDPIRRNEYKNAMIEAQIVGSVQFKPNKNKKEQKETAEA